MCRHALLRLLLAAAACFWPFAVRAAETDGAGDQQALATFRESVEPLLVQYCMKCHSGDEPKGDLALGEFLSRATVENDRETWEMIAERLHAGEMPPEEQPQPDKAAREQITTWIDAQLARFDCSGPRDPGRVTIRRLNRNEYDNTIRDLLGVDFHPADDFPSDDVGYGFDNIGDVLSMPTILLEKYLAAAEQVVARALGTDQKNLATGKIKGGQVLDGGARRSNENRIETKVRLFGTGDYIFRVRAWGEQAGDEPVRMAIYLDNVLVRRFVVDVDENNPQVYEGWLTTRGGWHTCSIDFENDYYEPDLPEPNDRNLVVDLIDVTGPYPPTFKKIIRREHTPADRMQLAREIITDVMGRAYRRDVGPEEVNRVLTLVQMALGNEEDFNSAIGVGLQAILASPHFLFRVELDPEGSESVRTLNDYELATRLSYFLWSSMPDGELLALARLGQLRSGDNLERQVRRMLADPKARALVENFAGQWLQLRNLETISPDKERYSSFDEALRRAMRKETELFFAAVVREDRSVLDFIDADFSYINSRLAWHYGIPDVLGEEFRRVQLDPNQRGGVLTHASVLTVTSNPTRTSPVKRGKWILENILGAPPPDPPPNVPELKEESPGELSGSLRERMEQHRANPDCAVCHKRMDPLGFGLENFDGIGSWRTKDGPFEIDASGELPSGEKFAGPKELRAILKARQDDFVRCLSEKMLTYGLGRGVEYSDRCTVEDIAQAVEQNDYKFSSLILAIVHSDAFGKRSGKGSEQ